MANQDQIEIVNNTEQDKEKKAPRKSMKEIYNFVYKNLVCGIVEWYNNEKGFGVIQLTDSIVTTEGDKVDSLFIHIRKYKSTSPHPGFIETYDCLFCDSIINDNEKVAGFSWHRPEWTNRTLNYVLDAIIRKPDTQRSFVLALASIEEIVTKGKLEKILQSITENHSEEDLVVCISFLSLVALKTDNASIQEDIQDVILKTVPQLSLKGRLRLWEKGVLDAKQFAPKEYKAILKEGIQSKRFYEQLGEEEKKKYVKEVLVRKKRKFDFDDYSDFVDSCLNVDELDEEDLALVLQINSEKVVPFLYKTYLSDKDEDVVRVANRIFSELPDLYREQTKEQLRILIADDILKTASDTEIIEAIIEGIVVPGNIKMIKDIKSLELADCKKVCSNISLFGDDAKDAIIDSLFDAQNYKGAFKCAELIGLSSYKRLEKKVSTVLSDSELFNLWKEGCVTSLPQKSVLAFLSFDEEKDLVESETEESLSSYRSRHDFSQYCIGGRYDEWDRLFNGVKTDKKKIFAIVKKKMEMSCKKQSRLSFQTYLNLYGYCVHSRMIEQVEFKDCLYLTFSKWLMDIDDADYKLVLENLALFMPGQQIRIVKKLFHEFALKQISNPLKVIDEALSKDTNVNDSNLPLYDLTSRIVIKALINYKKKDQFIADQALFDLLITQKTKSKNFIYSISNAYFDKCDGRTIGKFHVSFLDDANGKVEKVILRGQDAFYTIMTKSRISNFDRIVSEIKDIPGRRWDSAREKWIVPLSSEKEVLDFAHSNMFSVDLKDRKPHISNFHFYHFEKDNWISQRKFCDGRPNNNPYFESYWCDNKPCYETCIVEHDDENWQDYTMYDFCRLLGFDIDEQKVNTTIPDGKYIVFVGHINRFNDLLERLYCQNCGQLLYPKKISEFAKFTVTRFSCQNKKCPECNHEIYLNKCFNGNCNSIIDSRVSKQCPNGWYICPECGMCCATEKIEKRNDNIEFNNGFSSNGQLHIGHYEKDEYYCYICGKRMEMNDGMLYCSRCDRFMEKPVYKSLRFSMR